MKLATPARLTALCLVACLAGPGAQAAPGEHAPAKPAPSAGPSPAPASAANPGPAAAPAAPRPASGGRAERRRRSYAACNRASHQRGLYGGRRRRFLIRCRLGYERTRGQQAQPAGAPAQPGRKP